jgi:hypothetical protein
MTRGLLLRHDRGAKVLGVLAAAVLIAALIITGRGLSGMARHSTTPAGRFDGTAPYWIGDRATCPPDRPVLATSDGRSYPPGHPRTPPPQIDPVACYQTVQAADAAGYAPAPRRRAAAGAPCLRRGQAGDGVSRCLPWRAEGGHHPGAGDARRPV